MNLVCNPLLAAHLTSKARIARVVSEGWFGQQGYCLNCSSRRLMPTVAGTAVRDFVCPRCSQFYELKSAAKPHTRIVQDGGFDSMMKRIRSEEAPALMLMSYSSDWCVRNLMAIHPIFLTPAVVMKRKQPHRRPKTGAEYWMCDLDLSIIPADGKIPLIADGHIRPMMEVRRRFRESLRFGDIPLRKRGWTALVLAGVRKLNKTNFRTSDVYQFAGEMHRVYPENSHIEPKIRQQLQALDRLGYIQRIARGEYRVVL